VEHEIWLACRVVQFDPVGLTAKTVEPHVRQVILEPRNSPDSFLTSKIWKCVTVLQRFHDVKVISRAEAESIVPDS